MTPHSWAKKLFGFDDVWEAHRPAQRRRWGYDALRIRYGERLVSRLDAQFGQGADTHEESSFELEAPRTGQDPAFAKAPARGLLPPVG